MPRPRSQPRPRRQPHGADLFSLRSIASRSSTTRTCAYWSRSARASPSTNGRRGCDTQTLSCTTGGPIQRRSAAAAHSPCVTIVSEPRDGHCLSSHASFLLSPYASQLTHALSSESGLPRLATCVGEAAGSGPSMHAVAPSTRVPPLSSQAPPAAARSARCTASGATRTTWRGSRSAG